MPTTCPVVEQVPDDKRFSDPPLFILASLADGPKHGHAIKYDIEIMCGVKLGPGGIYGAIARLEQKGLIQPLPVEERRRPYEITKSGLVYLKARLDAMHCFAKSGLRKLGRMND